MRWWQTLQEPCREAVRSLRAHAVRSVLTTLGIVIGVSSVVAVLQLNRSLKGRILQDIQRQGSHVFFLWNGGGRETWKAGKTYRRMPLTAETIAELRELVPEIQRTSPENNAFGESTLVRRGEFQKRVPVSFCGDGYFELSNLTMLHGRAFTPLDDSFRQPVAILGHRLAKAMGLDDPSALGRTFTLGGQTAELVGVLQPKGDIPFLPKDEEAADWSADARLYVPFRSFPSVLPPWQRQFAFWRLLISDQIPAKEAETRMKEALRKVRGLRPDEPDNFGLQGNERVLQRIEKVTQTLTLASALMVGLSMLVGGIGVMNIMLVSVTERTREIGLRKALGAPQRLVRLQFLVEAAVLCALGGLLGLCLGTLGGSVIGRFLMGHLSPLPLWALAGSLAVPTLLGLLFGYYPARRAAQLDPIEALRYE